MTDAGASSLRTWKSWLALGGLVLSVLAGTLVPVYTDEIGWRFQERAAIDGGVDITFSDTCGPNTIARAPWFMMPVRLFSATTNRILADPIFVRAEGVACSLAWIALFWILVRRLEADGRKRTELRTLTLSLLGLGVTPYVLIISRPEQPLILATALTLLLVLARWPSMPPARAAWLKAAGVVALSAVMLSYHQKGVLYGVMAAGGLLISARGPGTRAPRAIAAAVVGALVLASANYWLGRFSCPGDPRLAGIFDSSNVASVLANGGRLSTVAAKMIAAADPLAYVGLAAPRSDPLSNWLPPNLFPWPAAVAITAGMFVLWGATILLALAALVRFILARRWRAFAEPAAPIALGLLGLVLVWGASQIHKNFYEAGHILPALAMLTVVSLSLPGGGPSLWSYASRLAKVALPVALISELTVLGLTLVPLAEAASPTGYIPQQPYSITALGYPAVRRDIAKARAASGMPTDRRLERPLVDDLTYLDLQDSHLPFHWLGVLSVTNGSITDPVRYLRSRNSDGVIVGCHLLSPAMRAAASRSGKICAISRQGLERLAGAGR